MAGMTDITTVPSLTIRPVLAGDADAVAGTLAAAFHDDRLFTWCIPDPARRAAVLPAFFRLATDAVVPSGEATLTADGQAAALWAPPGAPAVPDPEAFGAAIAELVGDDAERTFALMAMLDEIHPSEPHRFLWFVGTRPAAQGHGRGSALLRHTLERSDAEGAASYLDATSEANRRLYERHGFEVLGCHTVPGSPPVWSMRRTARPAG
jgi:ribosomal protein S18 acetylase RimI-like enzyme